MTRMEETEALRARTDVHYNCCQSVLVPFADLCGLDKETAFKLGANFGSGMRHGSTCGAVTGALMVLGLAGKGADEATALMRRFREKNQVLDCANLLRLAKERGRSASATATGWYTKRWSFWRSCWAGNRARRFERFYQLCP